MLVIGLLKKEVRRLSTASTTRQILNSLAL